MVSSCDSWILTAENPWQASDVVFNPSFVLIMSVYPPFLRHDCKCEASLSRSHFKALQVLATDTQQKKRKIVLWWRTRGSVAEPEGCSGIVGWVPYWCYHKGPSDKSRRLPVCVALGQAQEDALRWHQSNQDQDPVRSATANAGGIRTAGHRYSIRHWGQKASWISVTWVTRLFCYIFGWKVVFVWVGGLCGLFSFSGSFS